MNSLLKKVIILIPSYNEEDNIALLYRSLINEISRYPYKIIFIDDGSKDNTFSIIQKFWTPNSA